MIDWMTVEDRLKACRARVNQIERSRAIYNSALFQEMLTARFGILTERTDRLFDISTQQLIELGRVDDLSSLDGQELADFLDFNTPTVEQLSTLTADQWSMLPGDTIKQLGDIATEAYNDDPIRYMLSSIVQTGFPHRKIKGKQHFTKRNGNLTVTMSAPDSIGLPSGLIARLVFIHMCSTIVKNQAKEVDFGPSLKTFVTNVLGRPWTTGPRGSAKTYSNALTSLLSMTLTAVYTNEDKKTKHTTIDLENVSLAEKAQLWWDKDFSNGGAKMIASEQFYKAVIEHATPLDQSAIQALATLKSPMAFDLYCWLTSRYFRMQQNNETFVRVRWSELKDQLGTNISATKDVVKAIREALKEVKEVYPEANYSADNKHFLLLIKSRPHVDPAHVLGTMAQKALPLEVPLTEDDKIENTSPTDP